MSEVTEKTLGQYLQDWFIHNNVSLTDPLFADAIDLTIANAIRDSHNIRDNHPAPTSLNGNDNLS